MWLDGAPAQKGALTQISDRACSHTEAGSHTEDRPCSSHPQPPEGPFVWGKNISNPWLAVPRSLGIGMYALDRHHRKRAKEDVRFVPSHP